MCVHRGSESVGNCTGLWRSGLQRLQGSPVLSAFGDQEAEKMQNESLDRKTDGVSGHASILTSCATSRWAEDGGRPVSCPSKSCILSKGRHDRDPEFVGILGPCTRYLGVPDRYLGGRGVMGERRGTIQGLSCLQLLRAEHFPMWSIQYTTVDRKAIQDLHKYAFLFHRLSLDRNVVQLYPEVLWDDLPCMPRYPGSMHLADWKTGAGISWMV